MQSICYRRKRQQKKKIFTDDSLYLYLIAAGSLIMLTYPCNVDPSTNHSYTLKLGFTAVYNFVLSICYAAVISCLYIRVICENGVGRAIASHMCKSFTF